MLPLAKQQDFFFYYEEPAEEGADGARPAPSTPALNDADLDRLLNQDDDEEEEEEAEAPERPPAAENAASDASDAEVNAEKEVAEKRCLRKRKPAKLGRNNSSSSASSFDELNFEEQS